MTNLLYEPGSDWNFRRISDVYDACEEIAVNELGCDCYVNQLRKKYSAKEVLQLSKEESGKLGSEVAQICKIPELIIINITSSIPKGAT